MTRDRSGEIDPILYGRLCAAHSDAEEHYLWFAGMNGTSNVWDRAVATADGMAGGLALAVAIIGGGDAGELRTQAQQTCKARKAAGIRFLQSFEEFEKRFRG